MTEKVSEIESRCKDNDTCLAEAANASAASPKTSSEIFSSAIEFYVRSDEGINLYVDLNSSPSDWTEKLRNEVCICASFFRNKCQSLQQSFSWAKGHKEIASSFQWDNHAGPIEGDCVGIKSPSSSNLMVNNLVKIDQPDEADLSVISSAILSHTINADDSEHLDEDQTLMSLETDFNMQTPKLSVSEFCATEDKCATTLEFDVNDTLLKKKNCDPIYCGPSSPAMLEHQNSTLESEICENSTLQDSHSIVNFSVQDPESSVAGSLEMHSSGTEQCPEDVSCSPGVAFPQMDLKNVDYSLPISRKVGKSKIGVAMDSSECSQLTNSSEKMFLVSENLGSNGADKRKRKRVKNETKCCHGEPVRRVLRSVKHNVEVLPRRSRRLIPKAVSS